MRFLGARSVFGQTFYILHKMSLYKTSVFSLCEVKLSPTARTQGLAHWWNNWFNTSPLLKSMQKCSSYYGFVQLLNLRKNQAHKCAHAHSIQQSSRWNICAISCSWVQWGFASLHRVKRTTPWTVEPYCSLCIYAQNHLLPLPRSAPQKKYFAAGLYEYHHSTQGKSRCRNWQLANFSVMINTWLTLLRICIGSATASLWAAS